MDAMNVMDERKSRKHPMRALAVSLLSALLLAGCSSSALLLPPPPSADTDATTGPTADAAAGDGYFVNSGDLLEITVFGEADLSRTVRVGEDGAFTYPLLGKIRAGGLTPRQLEMNVIGCLREYLVEPEVTVFIKEYSKISVLGQVKKPGSYELRGRMTVTQAIALAGGFTEIAYWNGTRVVRTVGGKEEVIKVPVGEILSDGSRLHDIELKPNDIIVVPESLI